MEIINDYTKYIRPFESLMNNKGYRGKFEVSVENAVQFHHRGTLNECLQEFLSAIAKKALTLSDFSLRTYAEYVSDDNYKECHFSGSFDTNKGFMIERLLIQSKFPDETGRLSFRNNNEVPGKNAVIGRFRSPKPWDRELRGGFKYKRKW